VLCSARWLDALTDCAKGTGAAAAAPLTRQDMPARQQILDAGGDYAVGDMDEFVAEKEAPRSFDD